MTKIMDMLLMTKIDAVDDDEDAIDDDDDRCQGINEEDGG